MVSQLKAQLGGGGGGGGGGVAARIAASKALEARARADQSTAPAKAPTPAKAPAPAAGYVAPVVNRAAKPVEVPVFKVAEAEVQWLRHYYDSSFDVFSSLASPRHHLHSAMPCGLRHAARGFMLIGGDCDCAVAVL